MGTITINISNETEKKFREAVEKELGNGKGKLGKASDEALRKWADEKQQKEISSLKSTQVGRGMRAEKIRTYNFAQDRITDHRLKQSFGNIQGVLDGNLDKIISELKANPQESFS